MMTASLIKPQRLSLLLCILNLALAQSTMAEQTPLTGYWHATDKGMARIRLNGESEVFKGEDKERLTLHQRGNRVYFLQTVSNPFTGMERRVPRSGTVIGNRLVFRGIAMLPAQGLRFTRNSMVTIATISPDRGTITGKSTVNVEFSGMGFTGTVTGYGTLFMRANRQIPDIAVELPNAHRLVDGKSRIGFGLVKTGDSSSVKTFVIRNTGNGRLKELLMWRTGSHIPDFIIRRPAKNWLAPGELTTFSVKFQPSASGRRTATLRIASNDPDECPYDIELTGVGAVGP